MKVMMLMMMMMMMMMIILCSLIMYFYVLTQQPNGDFKKRHQRWFKTVPGTTQKNWVF